jgi:DNA-binding NarL/FixJ family response regulator
MSSIRILVVEDFEPWRRFISLIVEQDAQLRIICEVSDGLDAVQKAQELHPDLILLDIGLPKLNGIAASRQILRFSRKPKILFLSQESSSDVVREALRIGAGFVLKTDASRELLSAVKAVMLGEQFLSSSVTVHKPERAVGGYVPEGLQ